MTETDIQRAIMAAVNAQPDCRVWRNNRGGIRARGRYIKYGLGDGASDLIGIGPGGHLLAIEVKTEDGVATSDQLAFLALVIEMGGNAGIARSVDEALSIITAARARG